MKCKEILTEMALQFLGDIHSVLKTRLPHPWDFCRATLEEDTRLILNSTSYFIIYAAFIFWFIKYIVKEIEAAAISELTSKDYIITIVLAFATATQVLWPFFLISTWFLTCSFYPWATALVVLSLNFPMESEDLLRFTMLKSAEFIRYSRLSLASISLDGVRRESNYAVQESEEHVPAEGSQLDDTDFENETFRLLRGSSISLPQFGQNRSEEFTSLSLERSPLTSTPVRASRTEERRLDDIVPLGYGTNILDSPDINLLTPPTQDILYVSEEGHQSFTATSSFENIGGHQLETEMNKDLSEQREHFIKDEEFNRDESSIRAVKRSQRTAASSARYIIQSTGGQKKLGYCGRCWRADGLPFKPGFSGLREPYTTRSGHIYGPTVRFLNMSDYMRKYGL